MKYGELVKFDPIETVIQIRDADDTAKAARLVETYVMSDDMARLLNDKVISQLNLDEVVDNKGVFIVGNYGTGKSHLMSVISAIAQDANNIAYLRNKNFAEYVKPIAGRFEVLRIEIGAVKTSLRDIITMELEKDLARRGITFKFPPSNTITSNKDALNEMMARFEDKYGIKGYLLVIDELLDYLKSRTEMDLMLDMNFMRELGEFIKNSRFRLICGVQETLFDNPHFNFVASVLQKMKDRFEQAMIRREDIAYVVTERILKKDSRQKAMIREHLQKFCHLYTNMAERMEEFVELFPIHPAYIETFQRVYMAEKREVLKTISATVKSVIDQDVPEDRPGIISYDTYWQYIKENMAKKAEPEIKAVLDKSGVLEDIISRSFTKPVYKPIALQIIYALSVHRLTTGSLDVKAGLTVQNLKDDLCLYIDMPVKEEEFLTTTIQSIMKAIMETVSGQFIEYNKDNEQYYLDLKKDIDYDAKIEQKAEMLADPQLNTYYYSIIYTMLDWDAPEYVTGHKIYEYHINWEEKNIYRTGYLFMGESNERPTAQPPRDFYVYFLPPYGPLTAVDEKNDDEVFFKFKDDQAFKNALRMYAAAKEMEIMSAQSDTKKVYSKKAEDYKKAVLKWLDTNKTSCFAVTYKGITRQFIELLHGRRLDDKSFKDMVDIASSVCLSEHFANKYPKYPKFLVRITEKNTAEVLHRGLEYVAGKPYQDGAKLLESFGLLENGRLKPQNSMYAGYFIKLINSLPPNKVINAADIFENPYDDIIYDRFFKLEKPWIVLILASLIATGHLTMIAANGVRYDASNLEAMAKDNLYNLYEFKHIERPKAPAMVELKKLFAMFNIPEGLIINPNKWEDGVKELQSRVGKLADRVLHIQTILNDNLALWGELLIPLNIMEDYKTRLRAVLDFCNSVASRFNTPAKLQNFDYTSEQLDAIQANINILDIVEGYEYLKNSCSANVEYFSKVELVVDDDEWKERLKEAKGELLAVRNALREGITGADPVSTINGKLNALKDAYIAYYIDLHARYRLDINESGRKGEIMQGSVMANLRKLADINGVLSTGKFNAICDELASLKVCYELSSTELKQNHICPYCGFKPVDREKPVKGRLDMIEERLDALAAEWTQTLLASVEDPIIAQDIQYLKPDQRKAIQAFITSRKLPETVDNVFVDAINTLLRGLDKVELDAAALSDTIASWGPCTIDDMKRKFAALLDEQTKGKDLSRVRIIIKKL